MHNLGTWPCFIGGKRHVLQLRSGHGVLPWRNGSSGSLASDDESQSVPVRDGCQT